MVRQEIAFLAGVVAPGNEVKIGDIVGVGPAVILVGCLASLDRDLNTRICCIIEVLVLGGDSEKHVMVTYDCIAPIQYFYTSRGYKPAEIKEMSSAGA